jgi:outer membrane protein OmpA-like peptidoglycan-associated protein
MKTRILVTPLTAAVLVLSGSVALKGAPQASSNAPQSTSAQTNAAPQGGDTSLEPLKPESKTNFWDGDDPNLVNLVTHPFANKKYVARMTRPIKDRLNELDELTSANAAAIKDVDARAQHGLQLASEKTSLADQHATDAAGKAQVASLAANDANTRVSSVEQRVGSLDQYKASALTEIRFAPGQTLLSKTAKDALDQIAAPLKNQRSYVIEVRGFAPGRGQAAITASQKMADSVVRYLVLNHEIPVYRIYMVGMGSAPVPEDGTTAKRTTGGRVEVSTLKNDAMASAQR